MNIFIMSRPSPGPARPGPLTHRPRPGPSPMCLNCFQPRPGPGPQYVGPGPARPGPRNYEEARPGPARPGPTRGLRAGPGLDPKPGPRRALIHTFTHVTNVLGVFTKAHECILTEIHAHTVMHTWM